MTRPTSSLFFGGNVTTNNFLERSMSTDMKDWPIFSYSQMQSWDRCEMLWDYSYKRNWYKVRKEEGLNLGTELHKGLQFWYDHAIARTPKEERKELLFGYFDQRMKDHSTNIEMLGIIQFATRLLMRYVNEFSPDEDSGHKILATEHHFTVPFQTGNKRNFILQGYIDLLTSYDGNLWVWDHKSSEGQFWTPAQVEMEPQTPLYAAALREQGQKPHGVIINMIHTYRYAKGVDSAKIEQLFCREKSYRTDRQLNTIVQEMKFLVDDLLEKKDVPRRSMRLDCKSCSFQAPCALRIRGIDDEPLLHSDYVQKDKNEIELKINPERLMD
jgi:hypothetical protein